MVSDQEAGKRPVPHHMSHGKIHQRKQQAQGDDQSPFHGRCLGILQHSFIFQCRTISFSFLRRSHYACAVSCRLYRCDNILLPGASLYSHGICQKTDGTAVYSRHLGNRLFYPAAAGSTAHSRYMKLLQNDLSFPPHYNRIVLKCLKIQVNYAGQTI